MSVLFRVLVGAFVCIAPSVLFLGLWHGLKRMQDGELVERVAGRHGVSVEDLLPGTRSRRTGELDSAERRTLQRMAPDGAPGGEARSGDGFAPDDRDPP